MYFSFVSSELYEELPVIRIPDYNDNEIQMTLSAKTDCAGGSCLRETSLLFVEEYDVNTKNLKLSVNDARDKAEVACSTVTNDERNIAKYICY